VWEIDLRFAPGLSPGWPYSWIRGRTALRWPWSTWGVRERERGRERERERERDGRRDLVCVCVRERECV